MSTIDKLIYVHAYPTSHNCQKMLIQLKRNQRRASMKRMHNLGLITSNKSEFFHILHLWWSSNLSLRHALQNHELNVLINSHSFSFTVLWFMFHFSRCCGQYVKVYSKYLFSKRWYWCTDIFMAGIANIIPCISHLHLSTLDVMMRSLLWRPTRKLWRSYDVLQTKSTIQVWFLNT